MKMKAMQGKWGGAALVGVILCLLSACNAPASHQRLNAARSAYAGGSYAVAFREAELASHASSPAIKYEAAYLAGMSAYRQRDLVNAERFLKIAAQSPESALAGQALAELGLIYDGLGWYGQAARHLLAAASRLEGQDRANAYFYAAVAQQKLGQWSQARTHLILARNYSSDESLRARAVEQLQVTGYTLQFGAFASQLNAEREAQRRAAILAQHHLGTPRITSAISSSNRALYLVQAGQFTTFDSAVQTRTRLGVHEAVVVPLKAAGP